MLRNIWGMAVGPDRRPKGNTITRPFATTCAGPVLWRALGVMETVLIALDKEQEDR